MNISNNNYSKYIFLRTKYCLEIVQNLYISLVIVGYMREMRKYK